MSRHYSHLSSALTILQQYKGEEPFSSFLKRFFSSQKKFGSNDRKKIAHLCYCFFRCGKAFFESDTQERILKALFLCSGSQNEILQFLEPSLNQKTGMTVPEKFRLVAGDKDVTELFPWRQELSSTIDYENFCVSFFSQPDLFIRVRPGYESKYSRIDFGIDKPGITRIGSNTIALPNSTKLDDTDGIDKEFVVQDYSSQCVGELMWEIRKRIDDRDNKKLQLNRSQMQALSVWDCCAASGGKSILAKDILGNIDLTVSDIRETILINLRKRFEKAGIRKCKSFIADLSNGTTIPDSSFDIIIADVPCSGSGTWSRTPEQLYYFDKKVIDNYHALQRKIVSNVIPKLRPGGYFLYITCSVFRHENEDIADFIKQNFHLELVKMEVLKGYSIKADTMFAALFTSSIS